MPIKTEGALARLSGQIVIEDAEPLAEWLRATPDPVLDLGECTSFHSAVLQVMLAGTVRLAAAPPNPWFAALLPTPNAKVPP